MPRKAVHVYDFAVHIADWCSLLDQIYNITPPNRRRQHHFLKLAPKQNMAETALRVAILVISDTASEDRSSDRCIPVLKEVFDSQVLDQEGKAQSRWNLRDTEIVKDDVAAIQTTVRAWTDGAGSTSSPVNLIVTSGGTGFATKDVTPEVRSAKETT